EQGGSRGPCPGPGGAPDDEVIVDARRPALASEDHLLEGPGSEGPRVQGLSADAQRRLQALTGAGPEAVERDGVGMNPQLRHESLPFKVLYHIVEQETRIR